MRELGWCTLLSVATRRRAPRSRSASTTTAAVAESSPDVGSSQQRSFGSVGISWPMTSRLRSPPEMPREPAADRRVRDLGQAQVGEHLVDRALLRARAPGSRSRAEKTSDWRTVSARVHEVVLHDERDVPPQRARPREPVAVPHVARGHRPAAADRVEQRRLAAARRPHQRDELARVHVARDRSQAHLVLDGHRQFAEVHAQRVGPRHRLPEVACPRHCASSILNLPKTGLRSSISLRGYCPARFRHSGRCLCCDQIKASTCTATRTGRRRMPTTPTTRSCRAMRRCTSSRAGRRASAIAPTACAFC